MKAELRQIQDQVMVITGASSGASLGLVGLGVALALSGRPYGRVRERW